MEEPMKKLMRVEDRLSSLPDKLVHHILLSGNFSIKPDLILSLKDLTLFGCVSKRCRQLFLSTPDLFFSDDEASTNTCDERLKLMDFLDRMLVRRGENKIITFYIKWIEHNAETPCLCKDRDIFQVFTWVHSAIVRSQVERLYLCIMPEAPADDDKLQTLQSYIMFHCGSLRYLYLKFYCTIRAPSFAYFSNLKDLTLVDVAIVDEGFFKWISCRCKCIEYLYLTVVDVTKNVTIESPSLRKFSLSCTRDCGGQTLNHLRVSGEKLQTIHIRWGWGFDVPTDKSLDIFAPNLKRLSLCGDMMKPVNLGQFLSLKRAEISLKPKLDDWDKSFKLLCSLRGAEVVYLSERVIQTAGFNMSYWKHQDVTFFNNLKEITVSLHSGLNGMEFARFILEHANNLEKMVIRHSPQQTNVEEELRKSRMISNATLQFFTKEKQSSYYDFKREAPCSKGEVI